MVGSIQQRAYNDNNSSEADYANSRTARAVMKKNIREQGRSR